ncbi:MAG: UDP-3-O-acyl-N-acetylglucosamine deacetylase [Desulfobacteraceae bacterium]|nr:UDP-3-O-acyl-N-acetylglucosamine deacetylase [Desulfobacteraceae bacterium]
MAGYTNKQKTIKKTVSCSGVGVHSGKQVHLTVKPAFVNHGIKFVRTDLPGKPSVSAHFSKVVDTSLATVIGADGFIVSTIEHLMAAFAGLAVDNAIVEVNCYELPIMDGSAGPFVRMLKSAGLESQLGPRHYLAVHKPIELVGADKFLGIYPANHFSILCIIEYDHPLIRSQKYEIKVTEDRFENDIANARTFGFLHEFEYLRQYGLAQGASLENAVAVDGNGVINEEGLRYDDEFVRHKLLDCIGDFSLLGLPLLGRIVAKRTGHSFNHAFLKKLFLKKDAWQTCCVKQNTTCCDQALLKRLAN